MDKVKAEEHEVLLKYRDTMSRIVNSLYPQMNREDIEKGVSYSVSKRFKNFNVVLQNNYTNKIFNTTILKMLDYIENRKPIVTSYGTMFMRHGEVPNPMGDVIQSFLSLRKKHKKEMFKFPKGSEMFEKFNLLQALDK